jgi:hypothetical protein
VAHIRKKVKNNVNVNHLDIFKFDSLYVTIMEILKVATINGVDKFVVKLGGVIYNNCTKDADCPGRAVCSINQTWTAFPNMCNCLFFVQQTGANCETCKSIIKDTFIY